MSESYIVTETTTPLRTEAIKEAPKAGVRFTPLRSAIVVRDSNAHADAGETLSPLVPVRRQHT
ncbi:hypothetical protein [Methyloceanibacter caenitepidi]|uniref:Uncharacterized protein n=1 Tax=Methyloceanibacter caenitepidi TaxID=1384459 RepID=A0A0A8K0V4_9HYPH|nr:hypothetical protein [Methyloceanibacter caenitepidi]BAQ16550.1 hypothetical protein GL4_1090 [Methyloceanibacter caenitepidi]